MKKVRTYNCYNNGGDSRLNVYFAEGSEYHGTIRAYDAIELGRSRGATLPALLAKLIQIKQK